MFMSVLHGTSERNAGNQTMDVSKKDNDFFSSNGCLVVRNLLEPGLTSKILKEAVEVSRGKRWHPYRNPGGDLLNLFFATKKGILSVLQSAMVGTCPCRSMVCGGPTPICLIHFHLEHRFLCVALLQTGDSSLNGLKTFKPGRRKSLSFPVAIVIP
jgi:hypothetical protein